MFFKSHPRHPRSKFLDTKFFMRIYFDNASTTPLLPEVIEAMTEVMHNIFGNPSSIHADGRKARMAVEDARKTVAKVLGASIGEVFFTSCGTESNNMALKNSVRDLGVRRIISAKTEHHCVVHTLAAIQKYGDVDVEFVRLDKYGNADQHHLRELLENGGEKKTLLSLMHANNETGTMLDLQKVSAICAESGALFHTDTVQTIGYFPINLSELKVAFLSGSAHKFHGPKGCGFIYINGDNIISPFIDGGSQERNMRAGTENVAGIVGLAKALEIAHRDQEARRQKMMQTRQYFKEKLLQNFEGIEFNGDENGLCHYKILSASFPTSPKADLLLLNLDIAGISASGGSACSSGVDVGSHVLTALGADPDRVTVRFSFSHFNTLQEAEEVISQLKRILQN